RQADAMLGLIRYTLPAPPRPRAVIEGYTDQLSYQAGDTVRFHVSCAQPRFSIEIARLGAERKVVQRLTDLPGKEHPIPANASSHGCGWPAAVEIKVPAEWKSGYYTGRLQTTAGGKPVSSELFFVVRSATPGKSAKVLLQLATNTYNAYC